MYTGTGVNGSMEKEVGNDVVVLGVVNIHRLGGGGGGGGTPVLASAMIAVCRS